MARPSVTPTAYAVLGLLSFGRDVSGYELRHFADNTLRFFYAAPAMSQVYAELERLAELGLVTSREVERGGRRARLHRITAEGRRALRRWLNDTPVEPPVLRHHLLLRVFLGHLVDDDVLQESVAAHVELCETSATELDDLLAELSDDPRWANARLVAEWGREHYLAEAASTARLLKALEQQQEEVE